MIGHEAEDRERFYALARYPEETEEGEIEQASGRIQPAAVLWPAALGRGPGLWYFDGMPHPGHGYRPTAHAARHRPPHGRDAQRAMINTLFDQMPEDTMLCLTLVATPQDVLESHLNHLAKKAVGETTASEQTPADVQEAPR